MTKEIILSIKGLQTGVDEDAQGTEVIALADYYKKMTAIMLFMRS